MTARDSKWLLLIGGVVLLVQSIFIGDPIGLFTGFIAGLLLMSFGIMAERYP